MPKKIDINLKILEKLYLIDKLTYQQIADKLNVSKTFIYSKMKEINVKPRENIYYKSGIKWIKENQMPVPQSCCIHHINGIKDDNRIENLQMMPNSSHMELHNTMKLRDGGGRFI